MSSASAKKLAYGGAISLVVTIEKRTHELIGEPQVTFQGVADIDPLNGFADRPDKAVTRRHRRDETRTYSRPSLF